MVDPVLVLGAAFIILLAVAAVVFLVTQPSRDRQRVAMGRRPLLKKARLELTEREVKRQPRG